MDFRSENPVNMKLIRSSDPFNSMSLSRGTSYSHGRRPTFVPMNNGGHRASTATNSLYCNLYSFYVESTNQDTPRGGTVFKNPHCALCNGVPLNETKCYRQLYPTEAGTFSNWRVVAWTPSCSLMFDSRYIFFKRTFETYETNVLVSVFSHQRMNWKCYFLIFFHVKCVLVLPIYICAYKSSQSICAQQNEPDTVQ